MCLGSTALQKSYADLFEIERAECEILFVSPKPEYASGECVEGASVEVALTSHRVV